MVSHRIVTCFRHDMAENYAFSIKQQSHTPGQDLNQAHRAAQRVQWVHRGEPSQICFWGVGLSDYNTERLTMNHSG